MSGIGPEAVAVIGTGIALAVFIVPSPRGLRHDTGDVRERLARLEDMFGVSARRGPEAPAPRPPRRSSGPAPPEHRLAAPNGASSTPADSMIYGRCPGRRAGGSTSAAERSSRLSRLCTGRSSSTWGRRARIPAALGSNPS